MTTQSTNLYDLIGSAVALRKIAGTNGGEYAGPCPFCGSSSSPAGTDRLRVWPNASKPGWWCRHCEKNGDAIAWVRQFQGVGYFEACDILKIDAKYEPAAAVIAPPAECNAPSNLWQAQAAKFVKWAEQRMCDAPRAYLGSRGITHTTATAAHLGYNPSGVWSDRELWGLEPDNGNTRLWIPQGIVIPWYVGGELWKLQIRRDVVKPNQERYKTLPGSANALYNVDSLRDDQPAMLVEGPFDALAVQQVAGDLVGVAACGTSGARRAKWYSMLALCSPVLVSLDADSAGDSASAVWCDILQDGKRHRPHYADPAQMLQDGADVRGWVLAGLGRTEPQALTFTSPIAREYWQQEVALNCTASLLRLQQLCQQRGADFNKTIEGLK